MLLPHTGLSSLPPPWEAPEGTLGQLPQESQRCPRAEVCPSVLARVLSMGGRAGRLSGVYCPATRPPPPLICASGLGCGCLKATPASQAWWAVSGPVNRKSPVGSLPTCPPFRGVLPVCWLHWSSMQPSPTSLRPNYSLRDVSRHEGCRNCRVKFVDF